MDEINQLCEKKRLYIESIKNILYLEQSQEITLKTLRNIKKLDSEYDIEQDIKNLERYSRDSIYNLQKKHDFFKEVSYVYVLKLINDKYYVGISTDLNRRLTQHFSGDGSMWTKLHHPISVISVKPGNKFEESETTIECMHKYGWENVRGGPWCRVKMNKPNNIDDVVKSKFTDCDNITESKHNFDFKRVKI